MWDIPWQQAHGCLSREIASIQGFRRAFNKPSIINRGTHEQPGAVLNLVPDKDAVCTGYALEFCPTVESRLLADLEAREHNYTRHQRIVRMPQSGRSVAAHVYIYEQADVLYCDDADALINRVFHATGTRGSARDYIINIALELERLGIHDPAVAGLHQALLRYRVG